MLPEFGLFLLILALVLALFQASYFIPACARRIAPCIPFAAWLNALCICLALAVLIQLRLDSDFSVLNVVMHSNKSLPTLYKFAGAWGNHEGSMLLWVLVLSFFGALVALRPASKDIALHFYTIATQALVCSGVLLFIIFTSNPFERIFPAPLDGKALNPLLQDIALVIHPPLLYLGYVGFSIVFAYAIAALIIGRMNQDWARCVHPWIVVSWSFLSLGIGLGSWWAYRVLGWGGFWFWDPVENASLLPWLCGTALMHANIVLKTRNLLKPWVILLSIITFGLSLLGTFLVRSGVLTSVHSFANDPQRGIFILAFMTITIMGALTLYALRIGVITQEDDTDAMLPVSREGLIVINNMFVLTACATVLLGTIYPIVIEWIDGSKLTVGPTYFNLTFLPLMALPLIFAGLTPFMPWYRASLKSSLKQAIPAAATALVIAIGVLAFCEREALTAAMGFALSGWIAVCSVQWLRRGKNIRFGQAVFWGHMGVAVLLAGLTGAALWREEVELTMEIGQSTDIAGYHFTYAAHQQVIGPDYVGLRATFNITDTHDAPFTTLSPEYRIYTIRGSGSAIADIHSRLWGDLYAVIGESSDDGTQTAVRLYYRPLMNLFWMGFIAMAIGGFTAARRRKI